MTQIHMSRPFRYVTVVVTFWPQCGQRIDVGSGTTAGCVTTRALRAHADTRPRVYCTYAYFTLVTSTSKGPSQKQSEGTWLQQCRAQSASAYRDFGARVPIIDSQLSLIEIEQRLCAA